MKCLYISYDGALEPLGQSQIIPYLKGLNRSHARFVLLTFDKDNSLYGGKEAKQRLLRDLEESGIKWLSLRYHKRPPVIAKIFDLFKGMAVSIFVIYKEKINLIHARGYIASLMALFFKKLFRIKFIFDMRGFWADEKAEARHIDKNSVVYKITKYWERKFIKYADEVVVLTEQAKRIIENMGLACGHICVIPCCVDSDIFRMNDCSLPQVKKMVNTKFTLAYTGSLESWYMKDEMLDYFKTAREFMPDAHFLILSHSPKGEIMRLIAEKNLQPGDFTITSVSFSEMPDYLSLANAGIIFLSLGFSKAGCFPTKLAEFLSCGIPIITSSGIGDLDKIITDNQIGVIVDSFTAEEYRRSFLELLKLREDSALPGRCRQVAENLFSLKVGVARYQDVYSRLKK